MDIANTAACGRRFWSERIAKADAELREAISDGRRAELIAKLAHYELKLAELRP